MKWTIEDIVERSEKALIQDKDEIRTLYHGSVQTFVSETIASHIPLYNADLCDILRDELSLGCMDIDIASAEDIFCAIRMAIMELVQEKLQTRIDELYEADDTD